jgi:hypothetical protein
MPRWIEFHDSDLLSACIDSDGAVVSMRAYVHQWEKIDGAWTGTGWMQPVRFIVGPTAKGDQEDAELELSEGGLAVGGVVHNNWVPLPFSAQGPVTLWWESWEHGRRALTGQDVRVETTGAATFVERKPDDMRPEECD